MNKNSELYYVHDPMCSWCWGFSRALNELLDSLPESIKVKRLLGGLAPDNDSPMPESMQQQIKSNWTRIEDTIPGVKFNFDFWGNNIPRRSTYPACRAVTAAREQGEEYDVLMTKEIQKAYYQEARNPSDNSILIELAKKIGLAVSDFEKSLIEDETQAKLEKEMSLARELYAESFPNLVLKTEAGLFSIPIDYNNSKTMLDEIKNRIVESE